MMGTVKTRHLPSAALGLPAIPKRVPGPLLSYPLVDVFRLTPGACWETVLYPPSPQAPLQKMQRALLRS